MNRLLIISTQQILFSNANCDLNFNLIQIHIYNGAVKGHVRSRGKAFWGGGEAADIKLNCKTH